MIGVRLHPLPGVAADAVPGRRAEHLTAVTDEHGQRFEAIIVLLHSDPTQVRSHRGHGERPALPVKDTAELPGLVIDVVDDEQFPASARQAIFSEAATGSGRSIRRKFSTASTAAAGT